MGSKLLRFLAKNYVLQGNYCILKIYIVQSPQKLGIILEYKMSENWELSKNVNSKSLLLIKPISLNENQWLKYSDEVLKVQF